MRHRIEAQALPLALIVFVAGGCSSAEERQHLAVFAASSLTEAFLDLEGRFEESNDGVDVAVTFAGSQVLRLQIEQGAPAQVYASANRAHMAALVDAGLVQESQVFVHNELVVVVPRDNPAGIETFSDLPRAQRLVLGAENVPIGAYTRQLLRRAAARYGADFESTVRSRIASEESNVRLVRAKVELGEADAAIVFATDAASSTRVRTVPIPADLNIRADYEIGLVGPLAHPEVARRWIAFVRSDEGQRILASHGFVL